MAVSLPIPLPLPVIIAVFLDSCFILVSFRKNLLSKTHQDPPTIDQIYNCYYQSLGGSSGISSTSNYGLTRTGTGTTTSSSTTTSTGSTGHHHKHGTSTTTTTTTAASSDVITGTAAPVLPTSLTFNS